MAKFAVVGAGHAGVEAAFILAKAGHKVTLFASERGELPYFRPRLIAVAFGQAQPDDIRIKPMEAYEKAGIYFCKNAVTQLVIALNFVNGQTFDGVILAQGSLPFRPPFKGPGYLRLHTLWSMADALALASRVKPGMRLTIIGGGVLGLESALRATMAGVKVTIIEAAPALANGVLGDGEAVLRAALEAKGIKVLVGVGVDQVLEHSIRLNDGTEVPDDCVLCSTGARPDVCLIESAGVVPDFGVRTKPDLSLRPGFYVAGDMARPTEARPICSVRRATMMGALAAKNLLAEQAGEPTTPWVDPVLPLFMKVEDVEFHTLGDVRTPGLEEQRLDDGSDPRIWKVVRLRDGKPVGLRFVGTRAGFGEWEKRIVP